MDVALDDGGFDTVALAPFALEGIVRIETTAYERPHAVNRTTAIDEQRASEAAAMRAGLPGALFPGVHRLGRLHQLSQVGTRQGPRHVVGDAQHLEGADVHLDADAAVGAAFPAGEGPGRRLGALQIGHEPANEADGGVEKVVQALGGIEGLEGADDNVRHPFFQGCLIFEEGAFRHGWFPWSRSESPYPLAVTLSRDGGAFVRRRDMMPPR